MSLPERIAAVLAAHLGEQSADAVAHHVCAKYAVDDNASAEQIGQVAEFLRRGLVVYVGADKAQDVAAECARLAASEGA